MDGSLEVLSWGSCYALSTYRNDLLRVFHPTYGSPCVEGLCVAWLLHVGFGERKCVRIIWVIIVAYLC